MATIRPAGITGFTRSGSSNGESWPPTFVLIRTRVREREELVQVVGRNTLTSIDDSTSGFKSDAEKVGLFLFQSFILSHALRKNCDLEHFSNNVGYIVYFFSLPSSIFFCTGGRVTGGQVRKEARRLHRLNGKQDFRAGTQWLKRFMARHNLSNRRQTHMAQKEEDELSQKVDSFLRFVIQTRKKNDYR